MNQARVARDAPGQRVPRASMAGSGTAAHQPVRWGCATRGASTGRTRRTCLCFPQAKCKTSTIRIAAPRICISKSSSDIIPLGLARISVILHVLTVWRRNGWWSSLFLQRNRVCLYRICRYKKSFS